MDTLTLMPEPSRDGRVTVAALYVVIDAGAPRAGSRHLLRGLDRVTIGRGPVHAAHRDRTQLRVALPDRHLSSEHVAIERGLGGWTIRDLGSKNGVVVNGERVTARSLDDGDWIEIGETLLRLRAVRVPATTADDLLGASDGTIVPAAEHALQRLADAAPGAVSVLLFGETGVGKRYVARRLHDASKRTGGFASLRCAGLDAASAARALFDARGALRAADHGTLVLDEIADLPLPTQATLVRVLQERELLSLGEVRATPIDVRVIGITLRDLDREVAAGRLRADLYALLAGVRVTLPPLRDRIEDLGAIVAALLARHAPGRGLGLTPSAAWALCRHRWPLNIRELDHAIAVSAAATRGDRIAAEHWPEPLIGRGIARHEAQSARRDELHGLLRDHRGNLAAVARAMSTSRAQIHRLLRRFELDPDAYRAT